MKSRKRSVSASVKRFGEVKGAFWEFRSERDIGKDRKRVYLTSILMWAIIRSKRVW